jgi:hypothetical protein
MTLSQPSSSENRLKRRRGHYRGGVLVVTKGERRLGKTIRKLGNSVEFSAKETHAKESEKKYRKKAQATSECSEDSPVQSLRDPFIYKKDIKLE